MGNARRRQAQQLANYWQVQGIDPVVVMPAMPEPEPQDDIELDIEWLDDQEHIEF